jgi:steroid delta-isomerase-like uncharacterized protein
VAGGRSERLDLAAMVQDHQPGTVCRRLDGGLLGDHRAAQAGGERAGQPLDGGHGLRLEVGPTAVADQDQRPPAARAVDERDPQLGVEAVGSQHLPPAQAALGLTVGGLAQQPDRVRAGGQVGEPVDVLGQVLVGGQQREPAGQVQGQVAGDQRRGRVVGLPAGAVEANRPAQQGVGCIEPGLGIQPVLAEPHQLPLGPASPRPRGQTASVELAMSDPTRNKAVVAEFIDAVFTNGDLDAVDRYLSPGFVNHDPFPGFAPDREGMRQTAQVFRQAFPDWHAGQETHIAEGDLVAERFTARGTHQGEIMGVPPTGTTVTLAGINIFRVQDGQLVERWGRTDDLGFLQQLGIVPAMTS